jgi:pimeloyl-ACP methyl ester carboxylesterase
VFDSVDPVFAWAIGKALLIVIVSFGALVYAAYAVTWPRKRPPLMLESPRPASNYAGSLFPSGDRQGTLGRRFLHNETREESSRRDELSIARL